MTLNHKMRNKEIEYPAILIGNNAKGEIVTEFNYRIFGLNPYLMGSVLGIAARSVAHSINEKLEGASWDNKKPDYKSVEQELINGFIMEMEKGSKVKKDE